MSPNVDEPRIESRARFTAVGLAHRGTSDADFGALWDAFDERADEFLHLAETDEGFGVEYDFDHETGEFTYVAAVATGPLADVPEGGTKVTVPEQTYAVFTTTLEDVGETMERIYGEWLPDSSFERGKGPEFERYGPEFDPEHPEATFEVFVPVVER